MTPTEREELRQLKERSCANAQGVKPAGLETEALQASVDHLFERQSVAKEHEILAEALNHALGRVDVKTLKLKLVNGEAGVVHLASNPALLSECATRRGLQLEQWAVAFVDATQGTLLPLNATFETGKSLSDEQRAAVSAILSTKDQVYSFRERPARKDDHTRRSAARFGGPSRLLHRAHRSGCQSLARGGIFQCDDSR